MEVLGTCDNGRVVCRDFLDRIYEGFGLRGTSNLISSSDHVFDFRTSHRRMARKFAGEWVTMGPFLWGWTPLFRVRESGNNFRLSFYPKLGRTGQWLLFRVAIGVVVSPCKATPCYPIRWHVASMSRFTAHAASRTFRGQKRVKVKCLNGSGGQHSNHLEALVLTNAQSDELCILRHDRRPMA